MDTISHPLAPWALQLSGELEETREFLDFLESNRASMVSVARALTDEELELELRYAQLQEMRSSEEGLGDRALFFEEHIQRRLSRHAVAPDRADGILNDLGLGGYQKIWAMANPAFPAELFPPLFDSDDPDDGDMAPEWTLDDFGLLSISKDRLAELLTAFDGYLAAGSRAKLVSAARDRLAEL